MQQNVPNQAIHVVEAPNEKANLKDGCYTKAATVLGVLHIICGVISLVAEFAYLDSSNSIIKWLRSHDQIVADEFEPFETEMWTSVLFFISGGLAIGGARSGNKCLVVATMVMSIISAVFAGILLMYSAMWYRIYSQAELLIVIGAMMLLIAIASASLTCNQPFCCPSTNQNQNQGTVHYIPNQASNIPNQVPTSV